MRMVAQLSAVLAEIITAKKAKQFEHAIQIIENAYDELFGLSQEMIGKLDPTTIIQLLGHQEKIKSISTLLIEEGDLQKTLGSDEQADACYRKALLICQEALGLEIVDKSEMQPVIDRLKDKLMH